MSVALFAARLAWYVTSSSATTVLLKLNLSRSWEPIPSSAPFALVIAFFIAASTASGVCSQSGIVSTAFAFAAAARKSSTVFNSVAERVKLEPRKMSGRQRNAVLMEWFNIRVQERMGPKIYTDFQTPQKEF